jgi:Predicted membrane protein
MDFLAWGEVLLRALLSLLILFVMTKLMGRKQVSQLTPFDYIIGISIGSIAAELAVNRDTPIAEGVIGMVVYGLVAALISVATDKNLVLRRFFTGKPLLLIQHGKVCEQNLKKAKLDANDLLSQCRMAGAFSVDEIEHAILEPNGQLSVLKKTEASPVTPPQLSIAAAPAVLCAEVILDGQLMRENLRRIGRDEEWLTQELKTQHAPAVRDIFLALCDENGKLSVFARGEVTKPLDVLE